MCVCVMCNDNINVCNINEIILILIVIMKMIIMY